jgi:acetylornithine deacetylase/succinyl-diaminopimelate desuccinylase-like protein
VVELGVTNSSIHKVNESVGVEEIHILHQLYLESLRRLFS